MGLFQDYTTKKYVCTKDTTPFVDHKNGVYSSLLIRENEIVEITTEITFLSYDMSTNNRYYYKYNELAETTLNENFVPLEQFRENQLNSILDD